MVAAWKAKHLENEWSPHFETITGYKQKDVEIPLSILYQKYEKIMLKKKENNKQKQLPTSNIDLSKNVKKSLKSVVWKSSKASCISSER